MSESELDKLKEVEFYAATVNAWFNSKFEHDKSLLTLSAGAIGLLITLISTIGVRSVETLILYIIALGCFIVCLWVLLWIFRRNPKHLEDVVNSGTTDDPVLNALDRVAVTSFMLGVVFSSIIGVSTAIHSYTEKVAKVTEQEISRPAVSQESLTGVSAMKPASKEQASVNNVNNMRPASPPKTAEPAKK